MNKWRYKTYIALLSLQDALYSTDDHIIRLDQELIEKYKINMLQDEKDRINADIMKNNLYMKRSNAYTKYLLRYDKIEEHYKFAWINIYASLKYLEKCQRTLGSDYMKIKELGIERTMDKIFY